MSVNVRDWLDRDPKSVDIYRLLGRKVFDPDFAAVRKAVQDAIRGVLPYQSHSDRAIAAKAVELQYAIARASDLIGQKEKLRSYHRELLTEIHRRLANLIGPRTDASVVRQLLIESAGIHPDSVGVVWDLFRGGNEETCAARLEAIQEQHAHPSRSADLVESKPIEFHCPGCGKLMRTSDETAGRKGKCPSCGVKVRIPQNSMAVSHVLQVEPRAQTAINPDTPAGWQKPVARTSQVEDTPFGYTPTDVVDPADLFPPTYQPHQVAPQLRHAAPAPDESHIDSTVVPLDIVDLLPQAAVSPDPYSVPSDSGQLTDPGIAAIPLPNSTTSHSNDWSPQLIASLSEQGLTASQRNQLRRARRRIRYIWTTVICWLVALAGILFAVIYFSEEPLHVQWRLQTKRDAQSTGTTLGSMPADDRSSMVVVEVSFTPEVYGVTKTTSGWEYDVKPSFFTLRLPDGAVQSATLLKFGEVQLLSGEYVHETAKSCPKSLEMTASFILSSSTVDSGDSKFQFKDRYPIRLDATNRSTD